MVIGNKQSNRLLAAGFLVVILAVLVGGGVALYRNGAFSPQNANQDANVNTSVDGNDNSYLTNSAAMNATIAVGNVYSWDNGTDGLMRWDEYVPITDPVDRWVGSGECGNAEFAAFKQRVRQGEMNALILAGDLHLYWTPNYDSWSNQKFLAWNDDSTAICAVAGRYPLIGYDDRLVWVDSCGTGFGPDEGMPEYDRLTACEDSRKRVDDFFQVNL